MTEKKEQVLLSIGLLVSNRRDTIKKCIESLAPLREQVTCQLIVIDTGCDADIRDYIEGVADVVADFTWCNDFSKARNESLKYAAGEWFLYLDDDEWVLDATPICEFFSGGAYQSFNSASYIQRNYLDMDGSQYTDNWVARMTRRFPETHFESKIHEYFVPDRGPHKNLKAIVEHYGYVYPTEEAKWKHFERNRTLLEEMIQAEPHRERWYLQLLLEYRTMEDYRNLNRFGELGLNHYQNQVFEVGTLAERMYVGTFYGAMILSALGENRYGDVITLAEKADADERTVELFHIFLNWARAKSYFYLGEDEKAIAQVLDYFAGVRELEKEEALLEQQQVAPFVGECLDVVKRKEMYSIAICSGLMLGDTSYLKRYLPMLAWNEEHVYVFEEIVPVLISAMCTLKREPIFEEVICLIYAHAGLWEYFCEQLRLYEERGNDGSPVMELLRDVTPEAVSRESETNEEILSLAAGVKEQLHILIENGMKDQARTIFSQVRSLLPRDEELEKLEKELME